MTARHALGGPQYLSQQDFYFGINDVVSGDYRTGALFNPTVFKLYDAWNTLDRGGADGSRTEARRAVARGETLFNSKPIRITGVKGLNDDLSVPVLQGTCTTCHDTPNCGQSLDSGAARHRPHRRVAPHAGLAALHAAEQAAAVRDGFRRPTPVAR